MTLRIIVAGATGWTGSAVAKGVLDAEQIDAIWNYIRYTIKESGK